MSYNCELAERFSQPTLSIRTTTAVQSLPQELGKAYLAIGHYLGELGEQPTGAPFAGYLNMDMSNLEVEIGFRRIGRVYFALLTSHTPSKIVLPPTSDASKIDSFNTIAAIITATNGSKYKNAPTWVAGIA